MLMMRQLPHRRWVASLLILIVAAVTLALVFKQIAVVLYSFSMFACFPALVIELTNLIC